MRGAALAAAVALAACAHHEPPPRTETHTAAATPPPAPPDAAPPPSPDATPTPPPTQEVAPDRLAQLEQKLVLHPTGVAACDLYMHRMIQLARCDGMASARDQLIQSVDMTIDSFSEAFASMTQMDAKARKDAVDAATQGCTAGADALQQTATSLHCKL